MNSLREKTTRSLYSNLRNCHVNERLGRGTDQFNQLRVHELVVVWNMQDFDGQELGLAGKVCKQPMAMLVFHHKN